MSALADGGSPAPISHVALAVEGRACHGGWIAERLAELGFVSLEEQDCERGVRLIVYVPAAPQAAAEEQLSAVGRQIGDAFVHRGLCGELHWSVKWVSGDWAVAWTRYLEPVALTPQVTVIPALPEGERQAGCLYLAPAFAFGFGEHASSRLMARWIERECSRAPGLSLLDVGSGTGVLSLLAAAGGAARVVGVDTSLEAVAAARGNAVLNQLDPRCEFLMGSVSSALGCFDGVVANIEASVLLSIAPEVSAAVAPTGWLALSGFIEEQCAEIVRCYADEGMALELVEQEEDWCLLAGARRVDDCGG